jgi:hypothetical protein
MIKMNGYQIQQYPIFSVDPFEPNFRYNLLKGERVVKANLTFDQAMEIAQK